MSGGATRPNTRGVMTPLGRRAAANGVASTPNAVVMAPALSRTAPPTATGVNLFAEFPKLGVGSATNPAHMPYMAHVFDPLRHPFYKPTLHSSSGGIVGTDLPTVVSNRATPEPWGTATAPGPSSSGTFPPTSSTPQPPRTATGGRSSVRTPGARRFDTSAGRLSSPSAALRSTSNTSPRSEWVIIDSVLSQPTYGMQHQAHCPLCHDMAVDATIRGQHHITHVALATRERLEASEAAERLALNDRYMPLHHRYLRKLQRVAAAEAVAASAVEHRRAVENLFATEENERRQMVIEALKVQRATYRAFCRTTRETVESLEEAAREELARMHMEARMAAQRAHRDRHDLLQFLTEKLVLMEQLEARRRVTIVSEEFRAAVRLTLSEKEGRDKTTFELTKRRDIAKSRERHELEVAQDHARNKLIQLEYDARNELRAEVGARIADVKVKAIIAKRLDLEGREASGRGVKEVALLRDFVALYLTRIAPPLEIADRRNIAAQEQANRSALRDDFTSTLERLKEQEATDEGQRDAAHRTVALEVATDVLYPWTTR